jgi:hypothetical protein
MKYREKEGKKRLMSNMHIRRDYDFKRYLRWCKYLYKTNMGGKHEYIK